MKTLLLVRHAKSSWEHPGVSDHDRPLEIKRVEHRDQVSRVRVQTRGSCESVAAAPAAQVGSDQPGERQPLRHQRPREARRGGMPSPRE